MPKKSGRIAQDEILAIVEQAVALERQRIENVTDAEIDGVGGATDLKSLIDITTTAGMYPAPSEPTDPFGGLPNFGADN